MSDELPPRIYVASLSDYNAAILHGIWIDATSEPENIHEQVRQMLSNSPEFKRFPAGGPAEEWAIHEYDGFGGWRLSEYEQFETVSKVAQAIVEHGEPFLAWLGTLDDVSNFDLDRLGEEFWMHYRGEWESEEDYARDHVSQCGLAGIPPEPLKIEGASRTIEINPLEELDSYLDWGSITRSLFDHGNYTSVQSADYNFYVFEKVV